MKSLQRQPKARRRAVPGLATLIRAVKYANLPGSGHTIAQACEHFGITPGAYRRARREHPEAAWFRSDDEILLAGMHGGKPTRVDALVYFYDWINHAPITRTQVRAILERLAAQGMVRRLDRERYRLIVDWP